MVLGFVQGPSAACSSMSISDSAGNSWTPVWGSIQSPSGGAINKFIMGWFCLAKSTASITVTITTNATGIGANSLLFGEASGFPTATLDAATTSAAGGSSSMPPLTFVTALPNEFIFALSDTNNAQSSGSSVNSPFTGVNFSGTGGNNYELAYAVAPSPGTKNFTGTWITGGGTTTISAGFSISAGGAAQRTLVGAGA